MTRYEKTKEWRQNNREYINQLSREYKARNKEKANYYSREWSRNKRLNGWTSFCKTDYDKIENYELALKDKFDKNKWVLHHRAENEWKRTTLIKRGEYYNLTPDKLIWLPVSEHRYDSSLATKHPELSNWHKHALDL